MVLIVVKNISAEWLTRLTNRQKAEKKCMADYDTNKESSYHMYWVVSNLCRCAMSKNLYVDGFERRKNKFKFN